MSIMFLVSAHIFFTHARARSCHNFPGFSGAEITDIHSLLPFFTGDFSIILAISHPSLHPLRSSSPFPQFSIQWREGEERRSVWGCIEEDGEGKDDHARQIEKNNTIPIPKEHSRRRRFYFLPNELNQIPQGQGRELILFGTLSGHEKKPAPIPCEKKPGSLTLVPVAAVHLLLLLALGGLVLLLVVAVVVLAPGCVPAGRCLRGREVLVHLLSAVGSRSSSPRCRRPGTSRGRGWRGCWGRNDEKNNYLQD